MAHYWIAAAIILFMIELFIGTIYLLVLSLSLLGAAFIAWWLGTDAAMVAAAVLSLIGCAWIWRRKQNESVPVSDVDDLDLGQLVILEKQLPTGDWQVHYRGTLWEARPTLSGSLKQGDTATIIGHEGNILLIKSI